MASTKMSCLLTLLEKLKVVIKTVTIHMIYNLSSLNHDQRTHVLSANPAVRSVIRAKD